jgi:hypothetical protein
VRFGNPQQGISGLPSARLLANRAAAAGQGKKSACVKRLTLS